MNRRRALTVFGTGLASVAGCLSESSPATEEPTTDDGGRSVENIVVRQSVTYESTMGSGGVLTDHGRQYVVGAVRGGEATTDTGFRFETASDSWSAGLPDTAGATNYSVAGHERPFVAFTVPSPLSASNPRVVADDGTEWPIPDAEQSTFESAAPRFELDELTAPDSVSQGDSLSVSLTATNVSDVDGRFLAAIYWPTHVIADDDESRVVDRSVAAGEQFTATLDIGTDYTAPDDGSARLDVRGHVHASRVIEVLNVSTPE